MIFRKTKSKFASISRKLAQDTSLSFAARGMMLYLLSKTDNWEAKFRDLMRAGDCGKAAIRNIIEELEKAGYMRRTCVHEDGLLKWITEIYDEPVTPEDRTSNKGRTKPKSKSGFQNSDDQNSDDQNSDDQNSDDQNSEKWHSYMNKEVPNTDLLNTEIDLSPPSPLQQPAQPQNGMGETNHLSKFSEEECVSYATSLPRINDPEAFGYSIWKSGRKDKQIESYLNGQPHERRHRETDNERRLRETYERFGGAPEEVGISDSGSARRAIAGLPRSD